MRDLPEDGKGLDHTGHGRQGGKAVQLCGLGDAGWGDYPLRAFRWIVSEALALLEHEFAALYARMAGPSIALEKPLRAMLLQDRWRLLGACRPYFVRARTWICCDMAE